MFSIFGAVARRVPRSVALVGVTAVTAGTVLVLGPSDLVLAHSPNVEATCRQIGLGFWGYEGDPTNNVVTLTVDGNTHQYPFTGNLSVEIPWDRTVSHTWTWSVDANINSGDPSAYDASGSGSFDACVTTTTTTTVPPTTTTTVPPTTTTTTIPETTTTVAETTTTTTIPETTTTVAETTTTTTIPETTTTVAETTTTIPGTTTTVADTTTTTTPETTTTVPETTTTTEPLVPTLRFDVLTPVCDNDAPYLEYSIEVTGTPLTTASITFVNPFGNDVVYFNLPLSGRVLWPGAAVDSNGTPTDWPGWTQLADGSWQPGDAFDWARSSVQVIAVVNPIGTAVVSYPPATPGCAANPTGVDAVSENNDPGVAPQTANPALLLPQTA